MSAEKILTYLKKHGISCTREDARLLEQHHISLESLQKQIELFRKGMQYASLLRPCKIGDGIASLPSTKWVYYERLFHQEKLQGHFMKFVPASGAATRMFKHFYQWKTDIPWASYKEAKKASMQGEKDAVLYCRFITLFRHFPFARLIPHELRPRVSSTPTEIKELLAYILDEGGLGLGALPKGLLPFHRYRNELRTPCTEHLYEAFDLTLDKTRTITFYFTTPPAFGEAFELEISRFRDRKRVHSRAMLGIQEPSTNTIALDQEGQIVRDASGRILLRPGGHGSLLQNLQECHTQYVFIKNIDNITQEWHRRHAVKYKYILAGFLIELKKTIDGFLKKLKYGHPTVTELEDMLSFLTSTFHREIPFFLRTLRGDRLRDWLLEQFDRPVRVCGVVPNVGSPGGGPFWIQAQDGTVSYQIIESAQVNFSDEEQRLIWESSTHFNPVDIVCSFVDERGQPYDLQKFVDPTTAFITEKSYRGKTIRALEWPGLWNGSMAGWNTIFVEVPGFTFAPVKTVFDLLVPAHQPVPPSGYSWL